MVLKLRTSHAGIQESNTHKESQWGRPRKLKDEVKYISSETR